MQDYNFFADLLNKFSQLTPWVQVMLSMNWVGMILGIVYFIKEIVAILVKPFVGNKERDNKKGAQSTPSPK